MVICDNKYHILAISDCIDGNHHDGFNLSEQMEILLETIKKSEIDIRSSHLNADAGFDVQRIYPSHRRKASDNSKYS